MSLLQCWVEEMKLPWLIGQTINILYATLAMTYQLEYPVIPMFW